jgi:cellobiose-specific phosphotransferase system component IIC
VAHPNSTNTPFLNLLPPFPKPETRKADLKTWLMIRRTLINRLIFLVFMVLVGYSLAKAIQTQSVMGVLLSVVSLSAGVYFLYLVAKIKREQEETA